MAEQMKPSGIDWIGDIPESWKVRPLKYLAKCNQDILLETTAPDYSFRYVDIGSVTYERGITGYQELRFEDSPSRARRKVSVGDTIISTVRTYLKAIAIISDSENVIVSTGFAVYTPDEAIYPQYLYYFCKSEGFVQEIDKNSYGIAYPAINTDLLSRICIAYPCYEEQQAIADFLDKECAQIDSITADLEKQIELLQQYKKSLITETVTKGLDKSVPMKDSGVEWIGKIPEHWQKTRIKFEASIIGSGTTPDSGNSMYYDNGEHSWIQSGDLYGKDYIYETEKQLTNLAILECHALNWYTKDFVVVAMYGASVGNVAISKIDSFTNQACCVIKLNEKNDNRYLFYFLKTAQEEMLLKAFGGTQPNISQIIIKNLNFLNVPLLEQIEIADFLDSKCDMINEMLKSKKDQYDILIKHKKSLIYEYVTGKKRVKEVQ